MPNFFSRFGKLWGSTGNLQDPTDAQANAGWSYIGQAPPTVEQFNSTHQWWDAKDNWLFGQIDAVIQSAGMTSAATPLTTLRDAIRTFFRKYLTSSLTLYIDVLNGDDTTGDGSTALPWKTIQHAIDYLYRNIDGGGQNCYIQLKTAGTYAAFALRGFFNGYIFVTGDVLNKRNYIVRATTGPAINMDSASLCVVRGVSIEATGSASGIDYAPVPIGALIRNSSAFYYDQIAFGNCSQASVTASNGSIFWPYNGTATQYEIYGGGQYHLTSDTSGIYTTASITTNVSAAVTFTVAFCYSVNGGGGYVWNWNITGKANVTTPNSWLAGAFGTMATKGNLGVFPTATGVPPTLNTIPVSGPNSGGLMTQEK